MSLKGVASAVAAATEVTAASALTAGRLPMGDGARGLADATNATIGGTLTFTVAAAGPVLKQGANGRVGTFVCNGATPVTVNNTSIAITDAIIISLNTVGGTVGAVPAIKTITDSSGFTVAGTTLDTSTYNYAIIKNAA